MKKFGTPIGAGPGSESEKVGLVGDGTPFPVGSWLAGDVVLVLVLALVLVLGLGLGFWPEPDLIGGGPPVCVDVGWSRPGPEGRGGGCVSVVDVVPVVEAELELSVEVVLVVGVELELDELDVLVEVGVELVVDELDVGELAVDEPVVDELVVDEPVVDEPVVDEPVVDEPVVDESVVDERVVDEPVVDEPVVDELLVVAAAQLIVSDTTTPVIGSESEETGVLAGTLTGKVNTCPPASVTVTVHAFADAFGIAASPSVRTADVAATISLRLPNIVAYLLLPSSRAHGLKRRDHTAAWLGRYWLPKRFATANRLPVSSISRVRLSHLRPISNTQSYIVAIRSARQTKLGFDWAR